MRKQRFCDDKTLFYRNVFALVLPMALQNLINVGITSADVIMLGKVGEIALSSSSLAGQIYFIMSLILFGLTSGAAVITAQYWGKKDIETIEKVLGISMRIGLVVGILFFAAAQFHGLPLAQLLYAGDDLSADTWDSRGWDRQHTVRRNLLETALDLVTYF